MYLIDTSLWIDFLKEKKNVATEHFNLVLNQKLPFGITSIIYQEVLQGSASKKDFDLLAKYMSSQRFYHPNDSILSYELAAEIYMAGRKKGITIRSTIDCLIAQIAIEHDLILLHNDKDYLQIAKIVPLKLAQY